MLPGCHSATHVMVCEHSVDRLVAVSSCAPSPTRNAGNCLPGEGPALLCPPQAVSGCTDHAGRICTRTENVRDVTGPSRTSGC